MPKAVALEPLHDPTVNYALQHNDVPVIKRLRLTNSGGECLKDVLVRVEVEPDFASTWKGRITGPKTGPEKRGPSCQSARRRESSKRWHPGPGRSFGTFAKTS